MTRDQHRQRVYDAEVAAFDGTILTEQLSWSDVVATFHAVVHHPWWTSIGVPPPRIVPARRDARRSSADGQVVRIADGGSDALTIAHELAHHVVATTLPLAVAAHGPEFCAALLRVVEVVGGPAARQRLQAELIAHEAPVGTWWGDEPPALAPVADTLTAAGPNRLRGAVALGPVVPEGRPVPG